MNASLNVRNPPYPCVSTRHHAKEPPAMTSTNRRLHTRLHAPRPGQLDHHGDAGARRGAARWTPPGDRTGRLG